MTWPTVAVTTTNTDAGTDSPATARSNILDAMQKLNQIIAHPSALMQGLLASTGALRGYLAGCGLSTAGSSATISAAAGVAMDSANAYLMQLSAISKTTSAWSVGSAAGGLDTGTIANNTWYHVYVIRRPDTGVVDLILSTSASAPTLPANYTQYRRIGSAKTNGSAQWRKFYQDGDRFSWDDPEQGGDFTSLYTGAGTTAQTMTLGYVPLGLRVEARVLVNLYPVSSNEAIWVSDLSIADKTTYSRFISAIGFASPVYVDATVDVFTNTSQGIRARMRVGGASDFANFFVLGWRDTRGREA